MKRLLLLSILMFGLAHLLIVLAEAPRNVQRTPEQEAAKHTEMMKRDLQLSPEQVDTIYHLNLKYAQQRREASSREEWLHCLKQKDLELREILTPEQYEQHTILRQRNKHQSHRAPCVVALPHDTTTSPSVP